MSRSTVVRQVAKRNQSVPHCNYCDRSPLITEGGVEVFEVRLAMAENVLTGDLCDEHMSELRECAIRAKLAPAGTQRRRRTFEDSIVASPADIPRDTGDDM